MLDIEEVYCTAGIQAVLQANLQLMDATVEEACQSIPYGKSDTLGLDGIPESAISTSLRAFDKGALLITEEIGSSNHNILNMFPRNYPPTFYLSDPTDRSSQLGEFLSTEDPTRRIGEIFKQREAHERWEKRFGYPSIAGATSAITCIRHGVPFACAIVNFVTQELFVASRPGIFRFRLPEYTVLDPSEITSESVRAKGEAVFFRTFPQTGAGLEKMRRFVTFLGKSGYKENFEDSDLIRSGEDIKKYMLDDLPGGPSRPLYLSTVQPVESPVGFILSNGEKIGEWIHWIPFVRFGKADGDHNRYALGIYEIHQARPWTKEGILMATPPPYSIFSRSLDGDNNMIINTDKLRSFSNPSRIRSTLLVTSTTNTWAITTMERHLYRPIEFSDKYVY